MHAAQKVTANNLLFMNNKQMCDRQPLQIPTPSDRSVLMITVDNSNNEMYNVIFKENEGLNDHDYLFIIIGSGATSHICLQKVVFRDNVKSGIQ